jgi:phosphoesterase RecJ-like protein
VVSSAGGDILQPIYPSKTDHPAIAFILTHMIPDGDAIGSAVALHEWLSLKGIQAQIVLDESLPESLAWMVDERFVKSTDLCELKPETYDVFAVDCSDATRFSERLDLFSGARTTFNIDHHITNEFFAKFNFVDSKASSTGELIFRVFEAEKLPLTQKASEAIYVAISTDTGSFKYSNTSAETLRIAGQLVETGIDTVSINTALYHNRPIDNVRLLGLALNNLELTHCNRIAVSTLNLEEFETHHIGNTDTDGICEFLRDIAGVEVAIFLKETAPDVYKVSARSKKCFDVSQLALKFGGGGHTRAAGFTVYGLLQEVKAKILSEIDFTGCVI